MDGKEKRSKKRKKKRYKKLQSLQTLREETRGKNSSSENIIDDRNEKIMTNTLKDQITGFVDDAEYRKNNYKMQSSRIKTMKQENIRVMAGNVVGESAIKKFIKGVSVKVLDISPNSMSPNSAYKITIQFCIKGRIYLIQGNQRRILPVKAISELNRDPEAFYQLMNDSENLNKPQGVTNSPTISSVDYPCTTPNVDCEYKNKRNSDSAVLIKKLSFFGAKVNRRFTWSHGKKDEYFPAINGINYNQRSAINLNLRNSTVFLLVRIQNSGREPLILIFKKKKHVATFIDLVLFLQQYTGMSKEATIKEAKNGRSFFSLETRKSIVKAINKSRKQNNSDASASTNTVINPQEENNSEHKIVKRVGSICKKILFKQ